MQDLRTDAVARPREPAASPDSPRSLSERWTFLRAWLANPLRVAALGPSSPALAALVAAQVDPGDGPVIELGAGTGPVTLALLARGVRESDLALVESDPELAAILRRRFPAAQVIAGDAGAIGAIELFGGRLAGAVVSGIPVLTMPAAAVTATLSAAFARLRPGGGFYQYTYSPRCPVPRAIVEGLGLEAERAGTTFGNLPPAHVHRLTRAAL